MGSLLRTPEPGGKLRSRETRGRRRWSRDAPRSVECRAGLWARAPAAGKLCLGLGQRSPAAPSKAWGPPAEEYRTETEESASRTVRRSEIRGRSGAHPLLQVLLGAAAMGEPALGAGDQPPLPPRPPRIGGPSPGARSRPAASPSRAAGPPPPRRRPRLCL
ncbi:hypothetical protein U0070_010966 [Myodes glareolus]|uniref:Uncharacterized protein n=1 Tax=Myodes glareolus TaxID=447135 RepID=A0AAW0ID86_MYOGA